MTVREELHQLVDELPEGKVSQARELLETLREPETSEERAERVDAVWGKYAYLSGSVDDFLRRKHEDTLRELEADARRQRGEG
jgi:hypothetical protein